MTRTSSKSALALALLWSIGASAQEPEAAPDAAAAVAADPQPEAGNGEPEKLWMPWKGQLVYGRNLMTVPERRRYRKIINVELKTYEEQFAYWQEHVAAMQQRALERGVSIADPPPRPGTGMEDLHPIYGRHLMTLPERRAFWLEYKALETDEERAAYEEVHTQRMQERAERWSIVLRPPDTGKIEENIWEGVEFPDGTEMWTTIALMQKREPVARLVYSLKKGAESLAADPEGQEKFEAWIGAMRSHAETLENVQEREARSKILDEVEEHYLETLAVPDEGIEDE